MSTTVNAYRRVRLTTDLEGIPVVRITQGRMVMDYAITSHGNGCHSLAKPNAHGGETYHVNLDAAGDSCTCPGHVHWGYKTVCRHIGALKALTARGDL